MSIKNTRRQIITPIIIAVSIIIGILAGLNFRPKSVDNRFVIYPKVDKLNGILNYIEEEYVDSINRSSIVENTIPVLLENLDPHSVYIPAQDLQRVNEPLKGNFSGIGVQFNMQNDTITIITTIPNGPSEKVGILAGDRIITVEDDTVAGKNIRSDSIVKLLKGPKGTTVNVGIFRRGEDHLIDFEITRDNIPLYSVDVDYMLTESIGYIKISKFSRTTFHEFMEAVDRLNSQGMSKLIVDLRDNSGGYLDAATHILDQFFVNNELLVYTQGKARPRNEVRATQQGAASELEVAVLINEFSASASEILAGAIQDNDRGTIIGRTSFGKGLVQEQRVFPDGSAIRLTIARYYTPTGRCIQKPYKDGKEAYYHDAYDRYMEGMDSPDSTSFPDSLKYKTPKGKIVYGGGGITPDIWVGIDTTEITGYFTSVRSKGLIYRYAFKYTDTHRQELSNFNSADQFEEHLNDKVLLYDFVEYAKEKGVKPNWQEIKISSDVIVTQLEAYIARNIIDNEGFYPIIREIDTPLKKAVSVLEKQ